MPVYQTTQLWLRLFHEHMNKHTNKCEGDLFQLNLAPGFGFEPSAPRTMYCSEGEWVGRRPKCVPEDAREGPCNAQDAAQCEQGHNSMGNMMETHLMDLRQS